MSKFRLSFKFLEKIPLSVSIFFSYNIWLSRHFCLMQSSTPIEQSSLRPTEPKKKRIKPPYTVEKYAKNIPSCLEVDRFRHMPHLDYFYVNDVREFNRLTAKVGCTKCFGIIGVVKLCGRLTSRARISTGSLYVCRKKPFMFTGQERFWTNVLKLLATNWYTAIFACIGFHMNSCGSLRSEAYGGEIYTLNKALAWSRANDPLVAIMSKLLACQLAFELECALRFLTPG